jgi:NAD(P)H-dependent FMN reductase
MAQIIGIAGSLREGSFNRALLRAAVELAPGGLTIETGSIQGIPLYDGDWEAANGLPEPVVALKQAIAAADGLLLVSPEYNNSIPGVFKNAIDWLSRSGGGVEDVFKGKPVGLIGATPGGFGTLSAQTAWLPVLRTLGMRPWFERVLYVGRAHTVFDEAGRLTDEALRTRLATYIEGLAAFVDA